VSVDVWHGFRRRESHSCRYGDLPRTRQALASSTRRTAPRFSRVAPLPSAIAPPSPSVAHQEEPELGIGQVRRDDRGNPVRVVVRMRHHHAQRPTHRGTLACRFHGADFEVVLIEGKTPGQVGFDLVKGARAPSSIPVAAKSVAWTSERVDRLIRSLRPCVQCRRMSDRDWRSSPAQRIDQYGCVR
jgi:hypothetical protein